MKKSSESRTRHLLEFDNKFRRNGINYLCGVDEAGRGPLAGPVVAAAVIFSDDVYIEGVFDSKKVTPDVREQIYEEVKEKALAYSVGVIHHLEIDEVNILMATKRAMKEAIRKLNVEPELILADGNFYNHRKCKVNNIVKGDEKSFSVAAASILAKVTRDRMMCDYEKKFPNFSFSRHKGYGTKEHIQEILDYGYTEIHRRTFRLRAIEQLSLEME